MITKELTTMEKYDLCVIGGGPAGYAAAMRAIDFGKKVILIEKDKLGGAGIYNGRYLLKPCGNFLLVLKRFMMS